MLTVRWSGLQKKFLVCQRELVYFESNQRDENVWRFFLQNQMLQKEDLPSPVETFKEALNRLFLNGAFSVQEFRSCYQELMREAARQAIQWPVCDAEFAGARIIQSDSLLSVRIADLLLEASRDLIDYQIIRLHGDCLISRTGIFEELLSSLNLTHEEAFLAYRFEGEDASVKMLEALTGLREESVLRFLYLLEKIGAIELRAGDRTHSKRPRRSMRPASLAMIRQSTTEILAPVLAAMPPSPVPSTRMNKQEPLFYPAKERFVESVNETLTHAGHRHDEAVVRLDVLKSEKEMEIKRKKSAAERTHILAQKKLDDGDYGKTAYLCQEAIGYHEDARYYELMALAYAQHPKFQKDAEEAFHAAIRLDASNPDYHVRLTEYYIERKLLIRARSHCEKALEISPGHKKARELHLLLPTQKEKQGECWCTRVVLA